MAHPDKIITYDVERCSSCGVSLLHSAVGYESRQVFDLPKLKMKITEHRIMKKTCNCFGRLSKGAFPIGVGRLTPYGNRLKALCVYLQNYQIATLYRCAELIADLTGHSLSTGSLSNFQNESFNALQVYEQEIKK